MDLRRVDLGCVDFGRVDFGRLDLRRVDFGRVDFGRVDFGRVDLGSVDLCLFSWLILLFVSVQKLARKRGENNLKMAWESENTTFFVCAGRGSKLSLKICRKTSRVERCMRIFEGSFAQVAKGEFWRER